MSRVSLHICTKDRWSELAMLLVSIRNSTFKNFDIVIVDGSMPNPITHANFINSIINRIKLDGHGVQIIREEIPAGVGKARNRALFEDQFKNELCCRIDDDSILEPTFLGKLYKLMFLDPTLGGASGIVPTLAYPKTDKTTIPKIMNEIKYDSDGNMIYIGDDCGYTWYPDVILPAHHLRSSFMFRREPAIKIGGFLVEYGTSGFREETDFCIRMAYDGWKFVVDTSAICWHLQCGSGGVRCNDYNVQVHLCDDHFRRKFKRLYKKNGCPYV